MTWCDEEVEESWARRREHKRLDKLFGTKNPSDAPTGQAEALSETINDENVVLVDIINVFLQQIS